MPAVFFDRDGTLNVKAPEGEYVVRPDDVVLLPGAAEAVRLANDHGWPVVVVTNQRCVSLGLASAADVDSVNARVAALVAERGGRVDAWYVCPHGHGECDCRKPAPGLLLQAATDLDLAVDGSVLVGDSDSDMAAAAAAGAAAQRVGPSRSPLDAVESWFAEDAGRPAASSS